MANLYDLKKFDLNLLVIFECIYQHLSISKAAESLYITPSAVSQSLQRLRVDSICQCNTPFNYLFRCFELQCLSRSVV